jgi:hypothetical protein
VQFETIYKLYSNWGNYLEREREINYLQTEFSYERELLGVLQVFLQTDVGAHNC